MQSSSEHASPHSKRYMTHSSQPQLVLGFPDYREPAQRLARQADLPYADIEVHYFPDGESRIRLPAQLPARIILCRSLDHPNHKLIELELAAATARKLGARHLTLVAPYLAYMRQDKAFHPGEAVSQRIIGELLARCFDTLVTVDPHLHRVHRLQDAVPVSRAITLSASVPIAGYLADHIKQPFLIGPDAESEQWVATIAADERFDYAVASKQRLSDADVRVRLPENAYSGRNVVLVDDVASTGRTLEAAAYQLAAFTPASISVFVTHALFVDDALARLQNAGVNRICSTDSIQHATNCLHLDALLASAICR